jgi:hypothetical protein
MQPLLLKLCRQHLPICYKNLFWFENHGAAVALDFVWYNFGRVTPAMEGAIADHVWRVEEIVALLP